MIRVNLLAARQRTLSSGNSSSAALSLSDNQRATELLKRLGMIAIIPAVLFFIERELIPAKSAERDEGKRKLVELNSYNSRQNEAREKIQALKNEYEKNETQLNALKKLKQSQFYELRVIDRLQDIILERTWITEMAFIKPNNTLPDSDYKLELKLSTTSDSEADTLFTTISNQEDFFEEVLPSVERTARSDNNKIKDFGLSIRLVKELPSLSKPAADATGVAIPEEAAPKEVSK